MQRKQGGNTRVFQVEFASSGIVIYKNLKLQERTNIPTVSLVPHPKPAVDFELYVSRTISVIYMLMRLPVRRTSQLIPLLSKCNM